VAEGRGTTEIDAIPFGQLPGTRAGMRQLAASIEGVSLPDGCAADERSAVTLPKSFPKRCREAAS
jgi:hypothetical protein